MSDTSPAIPESIDPANQHKALTAGQQAVIKAVSPPDRLSVRAVYLLVP
ncbi:hypothetical protein ACLB1T_15955 [Escherichia coli]